jgi:hypothetical protein
MFGDDFERVFDPNEITPEILATVHRLFQDIEAEKHRAMLAMRQSGLSATSVEHWLVEGAFHVLFCAGMMSKKLGLDLSCYEACARSIPSAMATVQKYYESNDRVAAYRLFRSTRAREELGAIIDGGRQTMISDSRQMRFEFL